MLYKNAILNIAGSLGSTILLTIGYVVISRILGPNKMGEYAYAIYIITVGVQLSTGAIPSALAKFIPEFSQRYKKKEIDGFALHLMIISLCLSICGAMFLMFVFPHLKNNYSYKDYLFVIGLNIPFVTVSNLFIGYLQGKEKFHILSIVSIVSSVIFSILLIPLAIFTKNVTVILFGYLIYSFVNFILLFILSGFSITNGEILKKHSKTVFSYILSVSLLIFFDTIVWDKSEVFFLKHFFADSQIAFYSIAYTLVSKVSYLIPYALTCVLIPAYSSLISSEKTEESKRVFNSSTKYLAIFILPIAFGGAAIASPIINYLLGSQYLGSIGTLRVIFLFSSFGVIASSGSSLMHGMQKQNILVVVGFIVSIISIALDIFIIPRYAAIGAAFTNGITQMVGVTLSTGYIVYRFKLPFPGIAIIKSALAAIVMGTVSYILVQSFSSIFAVILNILISAVIYISLIYILNVFDEEDKKLINNILDYVFIKRILTLINRFTNTSAV